jgi:hypothetical protein
VRAVSSRVAVSPASSRRARLYYLTPVGTGTLYVKVSWYNLAGTLISSSNITAPSYVPVSSTTPQKVDLRVNVPLLAVTAEVNILYTGAGVTNSIYISGILLEETSPGSAFDPAIDLDSEVLLVNAGTLTGGGGGVSMSASAGLGTKANALAQPTNYNFYAPDGTTLEAQIGFDDGGNALSVRTEVDGRVLQLANYQSGGTNAFTLGPSGVFLDAAVGNVTIQTDAGGANISIYNRSGGPINLSSPTVFSAGVVLGTVVVTGNTTLDEAYHTVFCDTSGGAFSITLPSAASHVGREYRICNIGSAAVTLTPNGTDKIQSVNASISINPLGTTPSSVIIQCANSSGWWFMAQT